MNKIILLDLNYTLAEKTGLDVSNWTYDVSKDVYRMDLVEAIRGKRIFMITARTDNYLEETVKKIEKDTGLKIERYYFKPLKNKYLKVHDFKKMIVERLIAEGFSSDDFFGIESNANTRLAYKSIGVDSCPYSVYMEKTGESKGQKKKENQIVQGEFQF